MSDRDLKDLAHAAGLFVEWEDASGQPRSVGMDTLRAALTALGLPCVTKTDREASQRHLSQMRDKDFFTADAGSAIRLGQRGQLFLEDGSTQDVAADASLVIEQPGYHRMELDSGSRTIAIAPTAAPTSRALTGRDRAWGIATQLYSIRGEQKAPFGDFAALEEFAEIAGQQGADAIAISPVHALFLADPHRFSPYSPSSRDFINPLFVNPGALHEADSGDFIEWPTASAERIAGLRRRFADFTGDPEFEWFIDHGGTSLRGHAVFEALNGHFTEQGITGGWMAWPRNYHDPDSSDVARFAVEHDTAVRFHLWLQWRADISLAAAQNTARGSGMAIGLISDLAVGLDPGGSHAWSRRDELLHGLTIGAPPDAYSAAGQGWGITGLSPTGLDRLKFEPFLRTLRASLRHAGGVRIDHALGLNRLWVIPDGANALDGVYLQQPRDDLLRLLTLEAHRAHALVIAEDLGVVPPGFRDQLARKNLLGMRVLPFERDTSGGFTDPKQWTPAAAAMTSTHDMTPFSGWWQGVDLGWRERLGVDRDSQQKRSADRGRFWKTYGAGPRPTPANPEAAVDAAVSGVAQSACELAIVAVEDLVGLAEAPNLPGTIDEHPNWRRRLPREVKTLFTEPALRRRLTLLRKDRST